VFSAASAAVVLVVAAASAAQAHNVWMTTRDAGGRRVAEIHYGDVEKPELADHSRVVSAALVSSRGRIELRNPLKQVESRGHPALETQPFAAPKDGLLAITYDNGFWVDLPDKSEVNTSTLLIPTGAERRWTVKFGKTLLGPGAFRRVLDQRLELVPLKDPYAVAPNGTLPVRLLLNGKPYAAAKIAYTDGIKPIPDPQQPTATTGGDGVANIPLAWKGSYVFTVDINVPPMQPSLAVKDHLYASLTFDTSR
jgi:uncharacterized GH25 family protein